MGEAKRRKDLGVTNTHNMADQHIRDAESKLALAATKLLFEPESINRRLQRSLLQLARQDARRATRKERRKGIKAKYCLTGKQTSCNVTEQ